LPAIVLNWAKTGAVKEITPNINIGTKTERTKELILIIFY
jgi:hypothetical protein